MIYWSSKTKGFYVSEIHGDNIPDDKVEISHEYYTSLLQGQEKGKIIITDNIGYPILTDSIPIDNIELIEIIKKKRLFAYREEADPLFFKVQRGDATNEEWLAKINEIKNRFPYPG